jgi:hypothetical protein
MSCLDKPPLRPSLSEFEANFCTLSQHFEVITALGLIQQMEPLISEAHAKCFLSFTRLVSAIRNPEYNFRDEAPLKDILEEFDRYKLWAGNVGAAHSGKRYQISLDYRLREASFYKTQVRLWLFS